MRKLFLGPSGRINTFDFKPVGQGLFYTGSLMCGKYNFVFDCGTENQKGYIESQIEDYIYLIGDKDMVTPTIDFVVISHLHIDHYKGLYYLLQRCVVKEIILPYLGEDKYLIRTTLAFSIYGSEGEINQNDNDEDKFILFSFMCALFGVDENSDFRNFRERVVFIKPHPEQEYETIDNKKFVPATRKFLNEKQEEYWYFHFIQRCAEPKKLNLLSAKLKAAFGKIENKQLVNFLSVSKRNINEITKIYESVFGKGNALNLTSICLVHFPLYLNTHYASREHYYITQYIENLNQGIYPSNTIATEHSIVSILTGDTVLDACIIKEINSIIVDRKILTLQMPHHGSKYNCRLIVNNKISSVNNVISFGYGNIHNLPHSYTIDNMIKNGINYIMVTQDMAFRYFIE